MEMSSVMSSVMRVSIPYFKLIGINKAVLGMESALAYHGLSNQDYYSQSILITDKLKAGKVLRGVPMFIGVDKYPDLEETRYNSVYVVPWHIALCDIIKFNPDSEDILQALYEIRDEEKMKLLRQEAKNRNLNDLLDWELSEVDVYYEY